jgi:hypothetical protein
MLLLQVRAVRSFTALSGFRPLTSLICFLWLVKALEHNCAFVSDFGFLHFWLGLGSSLFVLPFSLCWVLCLIQLVRFQHLESILRYRFDINSLSLGLEISFLLKGGEGESSVFDRGGLDEGMKKEIWRSWTRICVWTSREEVHSQEMQHAGRSNSYGNKLVS